MRHFCCGFEDLAFSCLIWLSDFVTNVNNMFLKVPFQSKCFDRVLWCTFIFWDSLHHTSVEFNAQSQGLIGISFAVWWRLMDFCGVASSLIKLSTYTSFDNLNAGSVPMLFKWYWMFPGSKKWLQMIPNGTLGNRYLDIFFVYWFWYVL